MTNNKLVLSQYNSTSMNYTLLNTVNDLYTSFPELNNLCAFGKKLFVKVENFSQSLKVSKIDRDLFRMQEKCYVHKI